MPRNTSCLLERPLTLQTMYNVCCPPPSPRLQDQRPSKSFCNLLYCVPNEILSIVIGQLDCHSLRSLLHAEPLLRKQAVLIRHVRQDPSFFCGLQGVNEIWTEEATFADITSRFLIKMVECEPLKCHTCRRLIADGRTRFDTLTFVYTDLGVSWGRDDHGARIREDSLRLTSTRAKVHVENNYDDVCQLFRDEKRYVKSADQLKRLVYSLMLQDDRFYSSDDLSESPGAPLLRKHDALIIASTHTAMKVNFLRTLNIIGVPNGEIMNLHCPFLERLEIHFYKSQRSQVFDIPIVSHLKIPLIQVLKITFSEHPPLVSEIQATDTGKSMLAVPKTFEMSYNGVHELYPESWGLRKMSNNHIEPDQYAGYMDLDFLSEFRFITLSGVPDMFVKEANLSNAIWFTWGKTIDYPRYHGSDFIASDTLHFRRLKMFDFFCAQPDAVLPVMRFNDLLSLCIHTIYGGLNLNDIIWRSASEAPLKHLSVVCDLPASQVGGPGHCTLEYYDLRSIRLAKMLETLVIRGCYFGRDNELLFKDEMTAEDDLTWRSEESLNDILIQCVRPRLEAADKTGRGGPHLNVNLLKNLKRSLRKLEISQSLGDSTHLPYESLSYLYPVSWPSFHFVGTTAFKHVTHNTSIDS